MENRLHVSQLQIGMFVTELDRPWLDTPFLLQGFQIQNMAQLEELRQYCDYVTIDLSQAEGGTFRNKDTASRHATKVEAPAEHSSEDKERISILKELRALFSSARMRREDNSPLTPPRIIIYEESAPVQEELGPARTAHDTTQSMVSNLMASVREDLTPEVEGSQ